MTQIDEKEFEDLRSKEGKMLILFSADWCGPCKILKPQLDSLANEIPGVFPFYSIDVNDSEKVTKEFGIRNIPTGIILENGEEKTRFLGAKPKDRIKKLLENFLV